MQRPARNNMNRSSSSGRTASTGKVNNSPKAKKTEVKKVEEYAFGAAGDKPRACFVYGSLRPDDDSGMPWTEKAVEGMMAQKASINGFELFK